MAIYSDLIFRVTVELMGGLEVSCRGNWEKLLIQDFVTFKIGRHFVKTPSLKENIRILQLFGREKDLARARQIEIFLKTNSV